MNSTKPNVSNLIKYFSIALLGFLAGYLIQGKNADINHIYMTNGAFSVRMISNLEALNNLQEGKIEKTKELLEASVFGGLVGWESSDIIEELREREPQDSPYVKDLNQALNMAESYSKKYHSPDMANSYSRLFKQQTTNNKID